MARYVSIWFPYLVTDSVVRLRPALQSAAFVLAAPERGRMLVTASSAVAVKKGIVMGMVLADAQALYPALKVFNDKPGLRERLLKKLAIACIRFTPVASVNAPDGLLLDSSGCAHLWGGETAYLAAIYNQLKAVGYTARVAMADTIGAAWAVARYGKGGVVTVGQSLQVLLPLPPAALRLEEVVLDRMKKLGFYNIAQLHAMPRLMLRRRFGQDLLNRIDQAAGLAMEWIEPVEPPVQFRESLPSLEPIRTAEGITIALTNLLDLLCEKLLQQTKGLRNAVFKGYRVDGNLQQISIGTNRPVRNRKHLLQLFEQKISSIEPDLGIELFVLEAPVVEDLSAQQEALWKMLGGEEGTELSDLLDRIAGKVGMKAVRRYLPAEHYWPERSIKQAVDLKEVTATNWLTHRPRPVSLLQKPEQIEVTAPIPDYPPMLFIYKRKIHKVKKADGPERIEREWWLEQGQVRDYYYVEDEEGSRYWIFRSGLYEEGQPQWFLHGFFA